MKLLSACALSACVFRVLVLWENAVGDCSGRLLREIALGDCSGRLLTHRAHVHNFTKFIHSTERGIVTM